MKSMNRRVMSKHWREVMDEMLPAWIEKHKCSEVQQVLSRWIWATQNQL
jgi:hypothetical protein